MTNYYRIDVSEGIDVNKTNTSQKCVICYYWLLLDEVFNFNNLFVKTVMMMMMMMMMMTMVMMIFFYYYD